MKRQGFHIQDREDKDFLHFWVCGSAQAAHILLLRLCLLIKYDELDAGPER